MKTTYLVTIFLCFSLISCELNDDFQNNFIYVPRAVEYDLNNDYVYDISIEYLGFTWDGIGCSGDGYDGSIVPLNQNFVLLNRNEKTLFLQLNDTIRKVVVEPLYWVKNIRTPVVSISNSSLENFRWPNEWTILSKYTENLCYLGLLISKGDEQQIGWLRIAIDRSNGRIRIIDKEFSTNQEIIVDR